MVMAKEWLNSKRRRRKGVLSLEALLEDEWGEVSESDESEYTYVASISPNLLHVERRSNST